MAAKVDWDNRFEKISGEFSLVKDFNWQSAVLNDTDLFTAILADVIKNGRKSKRPGKRPPLSRKEGLEQLSRLAGEDFTDLEFSDAFRILCDGRSVRNVAAKTSLNRNTVYNLLCGTKRPTFALMEQIAASFGKHPSFFLEYRVGSILSQMNRFLSSSPDTATLWYKNLRAETIGISK